jgi:hypothetical protein
MVGPKSTKPLTNFLIAKHISFQVTIDDVEKYAMAPHGGDFVHIGW